jgi:hypothetical protein
MTGDYPRIEGLPRPAALVTPDGLGVNISVRCSVPGKPSHRISIAGLRPIRAP